jgi:hypothetical protein
MKRLFLIKIPFLRGDSAIFADPGLPSAGFKEKRGLFGVAASAFGSYNVG